MRSPFTVFCFCLSVRGPPYEGDSFYSRDRYSSTVYGCACGDTSLFFLFIFLFFILFELPLCVACKRRHFSREGIKGYGRKIAKMRKMDMCVEVFFQQFYFSFCYENNNAFMKSAFRDVNLYFILL